MKNLFIVSMIALFGAVSIAHADRPAPRPGIVAESLTSPGLMPQPAHGVRVYADGTVIEFRGTKSLAIAKLAPKFMTRLASNIEVIQDQKLVDPNPEQPGCMDAPITRYWVYNSRGKVLVGQWMECKDFLSQDYQGQLVKELLAGLGTFARFQN